LDKHIGTTKTYAYIEGFVKTFVHDLSFHPSVSLSVSLLLSFSVCLFLPLSLSLSLSLAFALCLLHQLVVTIATNRNHTVQVMHLGPSVINILTIL